MIYRIVLDNHRKHIDFLDMGICMQKASTMEDVTCVQVVDYDAWQNLEVIEELSPEEVFEEYYGSVADELSLEHDPKLHRNTFMQSLDEITEVAFTYVRPKFNFEY